jgi:hypothetical protein
MQARASEAPREFLDRGARIDRLRERLVWAILVCPAIEIQAAIDRAEAKRSELQDQLPRPKNPPRLWGCFPVLPRCIAGR